jgi:hypothetical protein
MGLPIAFGAGGGGGGGTVASASAGGWRPLIARLVAASVGHGVGVRSVNLRRSRWLTLDLLLRTLDRGAGGSAGSIDDNTDSSGDGAGSRSISISGNGDISSLIASDSFDPNSKYDSRIASAGERDRDSSLLSSESESSDALAAASMAGCSSSKANW